MTRHVWLPGCDSWLLDGVSLWASDFFIKRTVTPTALAWVLPELPFYSPTVRGGWVEQHSRKSRIWTICTCVGVSAGPKAFWPICSYQQSCGLTRVCSSKIAVRPQLPFSWVSWSLPISYTACRCRHFLTSLLVDTLYIQAITACLKYSGHYFLISLVRTAE